MSNNILLHVAIVGSGNWGSAISRLVGENVKRNSNEFDQTVRMWVFEEIYEGKKLSETINEKHENIKYLPGKFLPANVVAVPDLVEAVKNADILIFVIPHKFVSYVLTQIKGKTKPGAFGISLIKGLATAADGSPRLISNVISEGLGIEINVLSGANLAGEVADEKFCESTIGALDEKHGATLKTLFQTLNFRVKVVKDAQTVEACGALKNVVACGAGFTDSLGYGDNTRVAIIRLGMMEMIKFIKYFFTGSELPTFFESCGIADLMTTIYGCGNPRNRHELLGDKKQKGPETAALAFKWIQSRNIQNEFPFFTAVHQICIGELKPEQLIDRLRKHPIHLC